MALDDVTTSGWPTNGDLSVYRGLPNIDEGPAAECVAAAISDLATSTIWSVDTPAAELPAAMRQAALLLAAKLYGRRKTPDGVQGGDDIGVVRVSQYDGDVERLIKPYRHILCLIDGADAAGGNTINSATELETS